MANSRYTPPVVDFCFISFPNFALPIRLTCLLHFFVFMLLHFFFHASAFLFFMLLHFFFSCFHISLFMLLHFSFLYMWDICQNVKPERQSFVSKKTDTYIMYKSKTINFVKLTILLYKGNLEKFGQARPSFFFLNLKTSIQKTLTRFLFFI